MARSDTDIINHPEPDEIAKADAIVAKRAARIRKRNEAKEATRDNDSKPKVSGLGNIKVVKTPRF